jgi:sugar/nucleoside kinase (ribokinase family)
VADDLPAVACRDLVVIGSVSRDRITSASGQTRETAGGAGLYAGLGAAAAGAWPSMVGIVSDDLPRPLIETLAGRADVTGLRRAPGRRLRFDITYDEAGQATYRVDDAQAEELISLQSVLYAYPGLRAAHLCPTGAPHTQPDLARALRARPGGEALFLSATMFRGRIRAAPGEMAELVCLLDVLVCSAEDALLLTGAANLADAIKMLTPGGPRPGLVCVTDAGQGAHLLRPGRTPLAISACPAELTDPTGAGESFAGAFAARLVAADDPVSAARIAASVAAVTVSGWGPEELLALKPGGRPGSCRTNEARRA